MIACSPCLVDPCGCGRLIQRQPRRQWWVSRLRYLLVRKHRQPVGRRSVVILLAASRCVINRHSVANIGALFRLPAGRRYRRFRRSRQRRSATVRFRRGVPDVTRRDSRRWVLPLITRQHTRTGEYALLIPIGVVSRCVVTMIEGSDRQGRKIAGTSRIPRAVRKLVASPVPTASLLTADRPGETPFSPNGVMDLIW